MPVSFNHIPANIKVPMFYAEVDNSQAFQGGVTNKALVIGQMLTAGDDAGTATPNVPVLVTQVDQAKQYFGQGSQLARMYEAFRRNDEFSEVWCLPVAEPGAGVAATGEVEVGGPATGAGTIPLYIAGQLVEVSVAAADTATAIGAAIEAAVNANSELPVTASDDAGTVTFTAKWKGLTGNAINLQHAFRGPQAGEALPAGVSLTYTAMAGGTSAPSLATALANLGDEAFEFIVHPFTDATTLDAIRDFLNDTTGRWSYAKQLYGHAYSARVDSVATLQTFGAGRNDQHSTVFGINGTPTPPWEIAGAVGAQAARALSIDPARPIQTLPLVGVMLPPISTRFTLTEAQTLLGSGIATTFVEGGYVRIQRAVTTYQENAFGQPDTSYLDCETPHTLSYILRYLRGRITQKFPRHKLANDGTRFGEGQAIVTPNIIKAELIAAYADLELEGIVENREAFIANLIVERDAEDPNRVNVLYPPDLVNQLRIFAVLAQFRLQYTSAAA